MAICSLLANTNLSVRERKKRQKSSNSLLPSKEFRKIVKFSRIFSLAGIGRGRLGSRVINKRE